MAKTLVKLAVPTDQDACNFHDGVEIVFLLTRSRDSSVGIATSYGLDEQGSGSSSPGRVKNFHFSISSRPARVHPTSYKMGTGGKAAMAVKLTTHLQLVPRSRKRFHGVMLN
jgi:hypothetical protein